MPAGYGSGNFSLLDTIKREYKNAAGDIIATQFITILLTRIDGVNGAGMSFVDPQSINATRFQRTGTPKLKTIRSPKSGASAVVSTITTTGSFNTRTESSGDVVSVIYTGSSSDENDLEIPVNVLGGIFKVGDTI